VVDRGRFRTTPKAIEKWFTEVASARVAMEAGTHSIWISAQLQELDTKSSWRTSASCGRSRTATGRARATLDSLSDDAGAPRAKRLYCVYGTPDPILHHLTQTILPCLNRPEMFSQLFMDSFALMICSHLVGRYAQTHESFPQCKGVMSAGVKISQRTPRERCFAAE
jgi:hypothetical protein